MMWDLCERREDTCFEENSDPLGFLRSSLSGTYMRDTVKRSLSSLCKYGRGYKPRDLSTFGVL